jgi:hypothetical protein
MREALLLPSLSHRELDCDELNPGVYTSSYRERILDLSKGIRINVETDMSRSVKIKAIKELGS